jgi:hypothetical protein
MKTTKMDGIAASFLLVMDRSLFGMLMSQAPSFFLTSPGAVRKYVDRWDVSGLFRKLHLLGLRRRRGAMAGPKRARWYVQFSEGEEIAVTSQDLRDLAKAGVIHPQTRIRREDMAKAISASRVRGLLQHPPETHITETQARAGTEHAVSQISKDNAEMNGSGDKDIKATDRKDSCRSFFSIAEEATLKEDFQTALKNYSLFIENELSDKDLLNIAHTNRGLIYIHLGSIEEARQDLVRAIELGSDKARKIYSEFLDKQSSTTIVHQDDPENNYTTHSTNIVSSEPTKGGSVNPNRRSLWILLLGAVVNLLVYVVSPFGKGVGLQAFVGQLTTVLALTVGSYGIVYFFAWLARLLIKGDLPPVHRAIICSVVCTLIILGAILDYHIHGK